MLSKNVKVSQNFSEISRVSQSHSLSGSKNLELFEKLFWSLNVGLTIQRPQKVLFSQRETRVSLYRKGSYLPFATPLTNGLGAYISEVSARRELTVCFTSYKSL